MERLGRGTVADPARRAARSTSAGGCSATDPEGVAFHLDRSTDGGPPVRLTREPIRDSTNFVDAGAPPDRPYAYVVRPVRRRPRGRGRRPRSRSRPTPRRSPYLEIPLQTPPGYTPNDASAADLDGDGEYEIVVHMTGRGRDNASGRRDRPADPPRLQARRHPALVDQPGPEHPRGGPLHPVHGLRPRRRRPGRGRLQDRRRHRRRPGQGHRRPAARTTSTPTARSSTGPEFFTVFDGRTGAALATADYLPPRGDLGGWGGVGGNGGNDRTGNRADRFLACVAYLDGKLPSVVMCRGYYGRSVLAAWDWRGGKLDLAMGLRHRPGLSRLRRPGEPQRQRRRRRRRRPGRDRLRVDGRRRRRQGAVLDRPEARRRAPRRRPRPVPARPRSLRHPRERGAAPTAAPARRCTTPGPARSSGRPRRARTSAGGSPPTSTPATPGAECWGGPGGLRTCKGEPIGPAPRSANFAIWWDADPLREILDGTRISKWDWQAGKLDTDLRPPSGCLANNGSKATPCLSADLFGDWREEVVFRTARQPGPADLHDHHPDRPPDRRP